MTTTESRTDNMIQIMLTTAERAVLKEAKVDRSYGEIVFDVREGIHEPFQLPTSVYNLTKNKFVLIKIYPTNEQAAALNADAERCGITVGMMLRRDIFVIPEKVPAKFVRLNISVPKPVRTALAALRRTDEFAYTERMSESKAFTEIARVLMEQRLAQGL